MFLVPSFTITCLQQFYVSVRENDTITSDIPNLFQITRINPNTYRLNTLAVFESVTTLLTSGNKSFGMFIDNSICSHRSKLNSVCSNNVRCTSDDDKLYLQFRNLVPKALGLNTSYGQQLLYDFREDADRAYCSQSGNNTIHVDFTDNEPALQVLVKKCSSPYEKCNRLMYRAATNGDHLVFRDELLGTLLLSVFRGVEQFDDHHQSLAEVFIDGMSQKVERFGGVESYYQFLQKRKLMVVGTAFGAITATAIGVVLLLCAKPKQEIEKEGDKDHNQKDEQKKNE